MIDVNLIADWCMSRFGEYEVKKIAMDTYRYTLFKQAFEERGLTIEDKKESEWHRPVDQKDNVGNRYHCTVHTGTI